MLSEHEQRLRRRSLGASECGIVAGHSLYLDRTPFSVWEAKVFGEDFTPTDEQRAGQYMEHGIAQLYAATLGEDIKLHRGRRRVHPSERWMSATPDYFVILNGARRFDRLLECKWVGPGQEDSWDIYSPTGVPAMYRDQADWQMGVTAIGELDLAAFFASTRKLHVWRFRYENDRLVALRECCRQFWFEHVLAEVPPPIDYSAAAKAYLARIPYDEAADMIAAPADAAPLAREYSELLASLRAGKLRKDTLGNQLREMIGEKPGMTSWWGKATWKEQQRGPNYKAICTELGDKLAALGVESDVINAIYDRHTERHRVLRVTYKE